MKDILGIEIVKGCFIVYLDVYKSNIWVTPGKIVDINYDNNIILCKLQSRDNFSRLSNLTKILVISKEKYLELMNN